MSFLNPQTTSQPPILAIETATEYCSMALCNKDGIWFSKEELKADPVRVLSGWLDRLAAEADLGIADLKAIAVSIGPGSFTGLRAGISFAKGLSYGLDIPILGISSLEGIALGMRMNNADFDYYLPMIDARREEVYMAVYDREGKILKRAFSHDFSLTGEIADLESGAKLALGGSGAAKTVTFLKNYESTLSEIVSHASYIGIIGKKRYETKIWDDRSTLAPDYIKEPNITTAKVKIYKTLN